MFPYEPKAVQHKHGGRIVLITGIDHTCDKPKEGRSRDYWYYIGDVEWRDGSHTANLQIAPWALCYTDEDPSGKDEILQLSKYLSDYLLEHGEWFDKAPHEGWYATVRK